MKRLWGLGRQALVGALLAALAPLTVLRAQQDTLARHRTLEPLTIRAAADWAAALPFATSVLGPDQLGRGRARLGLEEALAQVPGVSAQNRYNQALDTRIAVRGFGARSAFGIRGVTLLLDGVPQTLPDGQGQLTNVDPLAIERVEVARGTAAAFYGNAAGGVVALSSAPLIGTRTAYRLRGQRGSHGLRRWSLSLRAPLRGGGAALDLSRFRWDGFRAHSAADLRHAAAALEMPLTGEIRMSARLRYAAMPRAENPGALTVQQLIEDPTQASARNRAMRAGKQVRQWQGSLELRRPAARFDVAAILYGVARDLDNPLAGGYVTLDRADAGGRLLVRRSLGAGPSAPEFLAGLDLQRQRDRRRNYDNDSGRAGDTVRLDQREMVTSLGARAALRLWLDSRTQVLAGLRLDRVSFRVRDFLTADGDQTGERAMGELSFAAAMSRELGRRLRAYASLGSAFETPTTTELANPGSGGLSRGLAPQRALQWELGLRARGARAGLGVAIYRAAVRDALLPYEVPTAPGRFVYRNTGRSRHRGAEAELTARLASWLRVVTSYALGDNRFIDFPTDSAPLDGRVVPGVPRWTAYAALLAGSTSGPWAELEVVGAGTTYADDANTAHARAWHVLNLRTGWEWRRDGRRIQPFLGVNNLRDRSYVSALTVNGVGGRFFEPAPGRNVYVGLELGAER